MPRPLLIDIECAGTQFREMGAIKRNDRCTDSELRLYYYDYIIIIDLYNNGPCDLFINRTYSIPQVSTVAHADLTHSSTL